MCLQRLALQWNKDLPGSYHFTVTITSVEMLCGYLELWTLDIQTMYNCFVARYHQMGKKNAVNGFTEAFLLKCWSDVMLSQSERPLVRTTTAALDAASGTQRRSRLAMAQHRASGAVTIVWRKLGICKLFTLFYTSLNCRSCRYSCQS